MSKEITKLCQICSKSFQAKRQDAKTCSPTCRKRLQRTFAQQAAEEARKIEEAVELEVQKLRAGLVPPTLSYVPVEAGDVSSAPTDDETYQAPAISPLPPVKAIAISEQGTGVQQIETQVGRNAISPSTKGAAGSMANPTPGEVFVASGDKSDRESRKRYGRGLRALSWTVLVIFLLLGTGVLISLMWGRSNHNGLDALSQAQRRQHQQVVQQQTAITNRTTQLELKVAALSTKVDSLPVTPASSSGISNNAASSSSSSLPANVTLAGNTFNGPNNLVQLTSSGLLPALDGSNLTNINATTLQGQTSNYYTNATNITNGTLSDSRLSNNVALLNGTNTFSGINKFQPGTNSSTAFSIQNAGGSITLFNADTTGSGALAFGAPASFSSTAVFNTLGAAGNTSLCLNGSNQLATCSGGGGSGVTSLDGLVGGLTIANSSGAVSTITIDSATTGQKGLTQYGSSANTAAQGNTSLSFTGTGNLTGTVSGTAGGGFTANTLAIVNSPTFSGNLVAQGSAGVTIGVLGTTAGKLVLNTIGTSAVTLQSASQANAVALSIPADTNATDAVCLLTLANCGSGATGSASGDLTGTYPNPTIAKLQGTTLTISSIASGDVLQYNGSAIVNGLITNANLTSGSFGNITGVGALTSGSIGGSFTNINIGSNTFTGNGSGLTSLNGSNISSGTVADARLTTNVTLQGNTFNGNSQLVQLTAGGLLPVLNGSNLTNLNGSSIASGTVADARLTTNVTLQGNTFNGNSQLVQLTAGGLLPVLNGSNLTNLNGSNIASGTVADARLSTNVTLQGNTFNGNSQLVQLTSGGLLPVLNGSNLTNLNGSNVASGTVANARLVNSGALTVTAGTGLTGGGSVALGGSTTLNVAYGNTAGTAAQGNTSLSFTGSGNLTGTVSGTAGGGFTTNTLALVSSPTFAGNLTVQGATGVTIGSTTNTGLLNLLDGTNDGFSASIGLSGTLGASQSFTLPASGGTLCTTSTCVAGSSTAGGDLTGTYPNPTIAKLQGTTLTISSIASGDVLQYNGSAIVNGHITNANLTSGSFGNITGVGALTSGSIGGSFTNINIGSNTFTGNGSGLTNLNGSNIATGTVADARLTTNVTLQGNTFNGNSQLVQLTAGGLLPVLNGSNLTNLNGSNIASGTVADARLSTNVTLQGNTFNGASQLVQLTSGGLLPVLNGSNLTNLNGSSIASGTVADARLSTNVTLQGNTFNGASQLVQLTAGGLLPVLDGSNLTSLNGSNISSGTVANSRLTGSGTLTVTAGTNLSGGGSVALGSSVTLNVANSPTFSGNVIVQGSTGITIGVVGTTAGNLVLATASTGSVTLSSANQANALALSIPADTNTTDTLCLQTKANCSATGTAGGDLQGTYPNPTIAKLQGSTLTISSIATGDVLQYSGSAIVNGHITNSNLTSGSFSSITGVGTLTGGLNIASGQTYTINGADINTAGTLSNVAYLNGTGPQTFTGNNKFTGTFLDKNAGDSPAAFQIQSSTAVPLFTVDTQNSLTTVRGGSGSASQGSELITDGTFAGGTWTTTGWTVASSQATHTTGNTSVLSTTQVSVTAGSTYMVTFTITGVPFNNTATLTPSIGGTAGTTISGSDPAEVQVITATTTGPLQFTPSSVWGGTISSVSVKLVTPAAPELAVQSSAGITSLEVRANASAQSTYIGLNAGIYATDCGLGFCSNVGIGQNALQRDLQGGGNVAVGNGTLTNNTTSNNVAIGTKALNSSISGTANVAVGYQALQLTINGSSNSAFGYQALQNNTNGTNNTAVGNLALLNATTGQFNTAIGDSALSGSLVSGKQNSAVGASALAVASGAASDNQALGYQALNTVTTGNKNIGIGTAAGSLDGTHKLTTGSANTFLGYNSTVGALTANQLSNAIAIGAFSTVDQSNALILGCVNTVNGCTATTTVGIGSAFAPNALTVSPGTYGTNGTAGTATTISQSTTTITGSGTTFTSAMTGGTIYYSDGTTATVTFVSTTSLTSSVSKTVAGGSTYTIVYGGFNVTGTATASLQPTTDSATAFSIQNASGTALFVADTTNMTITVSGNTTTFASLTLTNAHFKSTQTTAPAIGTPTACGTSPTASMGTGATDSAGSFTINTGSTTATATCQVVITFNKPYGTGPKSIVLTGASTNAAKETPAVTAITTGNPTSFTVVMPVTATVSTAYQFYYWVVE